MKIGIIGAGKVGFSLGRFLARGDVRVIGYCSRNPESAREAAAFTNSEWFEDLYSLVNESDAVFLTVPDSAISDVFSEISRFEIKDKYICHCSGALSAAEAFPGIENTGARGVSIHPIIPVSDRLNSYRELPDAFFCLEGDEQGVSVFGGLLEGLGAKTQKISPENKIRYHSGCVFASNLMCALVQESVELLTSCGFTESGAVSALAPLMRSNLEHIINEGPAASLTGPVERCDVSTVKKHLEHFNSPAQKELYILLSAELVKLAGVKHPERDYSEMDMLLDEKRNKKL